MTCFEMKFYQSLPSFNAHFYDLLLVQLQDQSERTLLLYVVDAFYLFVWLFVFFFFFFFFFLLFFIQLFVFTTGCDYLALEIF